MVVRLAPDRDALLARACLNILVTGSQLCFKMQQNILFIWGQEAVRDLQCLKFDRERLPWGAKEGLRGCQNAVLCDNPPLLAAHAHN